MLLLVPVPCVMWLALLAVIALLMMAIAKIFWLFLFTVGPTAIAGILFVRWCWDRQDRRQRARDLARVELILNRKEEL